MLARSLGFVLIGLNCLGIATASEPLSALDLVSADVALCVEIPRFNETLADLETSPFIERLRAFPMAQRLLEGRGFDQWRKMDQQSAKLTGTPLSTQLRALFANSLVVAISVPAAGPPEGILIGESTDEAGVKSGFATWDQLEPKRILTAKTYRGHAYQHRKRHPNAPDELFVVTSGRWFAISDREARIHAVIDRYLDATAADAGRTHSNSLRHSALFVKNRQRLKEGCTAYFYLNARSWDRDLKMLSRDEHDPINPMEIWKHCKAVSASLDIEQGPVCDAVVDLETENLPPEWTQVVAAAKGLPSWAGRVPADAIVAVSGHWEVTSLIAFVMNRIPPRDRDEVSKIRRIAQSLLGGHDVLDVVVPALVRDLCGYIVTRVDDRSRRVVLDGAIAFQLDPRDDKGFSADVFQGLRTGITLLAACFSAEGTEVVVAKHERLEEGLVSYLSGVAPFSWACGLNENQIVVAASRQRALQMMAKFTSNESNPRLGEHARRYFPDANQLIWCDATLARLMLDQSPADMARLFAGNSARGVVAWENRFEQLRPILSLVDSIFIAGRIEADHFRVTFGGALDAPK